MKHVTCQPKADISMCQEVCFYPENYIVNYSANKASFEPLFTFVTRKYYFGGDKWRKPEKEHTIHFENNT